MIKIIDNFFENPLEIRKIALNLIQEQHSCILNDSKKFYPGVRVECPHEITEYIGEQIKTFFDIKLKNTVSRFHITSRIHGHGLTHFDPADYAALIYLNENPPKDSGTIFCNLLPESHVRPEGFYETSVSEDIETIESFAKYKEFYNKEYFNVDKIVENKFNRFLFYSGKQYHSPQYCFGNNTFNSRLILITTWDTYSSPNMWPPE